MPPQMPDLVSEVRTGSYEAECRQQCAYNLPGMMVCAGHVPAPQEHHDALDTTPPPPDSSSEATKPGWRETLLPALTSFVSDPSVPVRVTTARAFHQVGTGGEWGGRVGEGMRG